MGIKRMRLEIMTVLYLTTITSAAHNPKVHEDVLDHSPAPSTVQYQKQPQQYQQTQQIKQKVQQPQQESFKTVFLQPSFNYQKSIHQLDPLKSRYAQQQQVDFASLQRNVKDRKMGLADLLRIEAYLAQNRGKLMLIPFEEPLALNLDSPQNIDKDKKSSTTKSKNTTPAKLEYTKISNKENTKELLDRKDTIEPSKQRYIYIQPSILRNSFGLDSKVAQQILQRSAPKKIMQNHQDHYPITDLQDLIGKNPNVQLEGLTRLLKPHGQSSSHPTSYSRTVIKSPKPFQPHVNYIPRAQDDKVSAAASSHQEVVPIPNFQLGPNRTLKDIQRELDAVSKAQAQAAIAEAQKYAMAQVEAQHKAIALAQAKAQEDALAKIASQGLQTQFVNGNQELSGPEAQHEALTLSQSQQHFENNQILQAQEAPSSYSNIHTNIPNVAPDYNNYVPSNVYSAVSEGQAVPEYSQAHDGVAQQDVAADLSQQHNIEYVEHNDNNALVGNNEAQPLSLNLHKNENNGFGYSTPQPETFHQIILESNHQTQNVKQIYLKKEKPKPEQTTANDLQYAAKYAFGYRILDAKEGSDFGHEEKRNGKSAKGHYHVLLPDGRLQKVEYYADDDGYHAKVTYQNEAKH